jgi:hypothetical protein
MIQAMTPDMITHTWEVRDYDLREYKTDTGLKIRCGKYLQLAVLPLCTIHHHGFLLY